MKIGQPSVYFISIALLSAALFGLATPASKAMLRDFSTFQLAGLLYLGGALGVLLNVIRQNSIRFPWVMSGANRGRLAGAVLFGGILGPVLLLFGLKLASAASVSMWLNLELVATAVLGRFLFKDHLGRFGWIGVAGVVSAGMLLSFNEGAAGLWAGLFVAGACLSWGFDNHFTALIDGMSPSESTLWKGFAAGTSNLLIGLATAPFQASLTLAGGALIIGILSYGASIALYIRAAQGLGATRAQLFFASSPFFGVALSAVLLGESISHLQILAAAILAASLLLLFRDRHGHEHQHAALVHEHSHRHDDGHHTHIHTEIEPSHRHSHAHEHEPVRHSHPHWPDIHHRHEHSSN